jgi:oligopeptide transport system permease protein
MKLRVLISLGFLLLLMSGSLLVLLFEAPLTGGALAAPNWQHWFGTDVLGRDLVFRVLEGTRVSLGIGFFATLGSFAVAMMVAFAAFQSPRWLDEAIMRGVEILMALPSLVVIALVVLLISNAIVEKNQIDKMIVVSSSLILTSWFSLARQIRSLLQAEKQKAYIESARALGAKPLRIYFFHLIPNLSTPLLVLVGLQIPNQLLFESFLSFVGLGMQPPTASWGVLIQEGWRTLSSYPHLILIPSLVLFLTVLSFNLLIEELRKSLNPRNRGPMK